MDSTDVRHTVCNRIGEYSRLPLIISRRYGCAFPRNERHRVRRRLYNRNLPIMEPRVFFVNEERPVRRDTLHFRCRRRCRRRCDADARCQWTPPTSADSNWTANGRRCDADADADTDATHKANGRNGFYPPRGALMI